jgi:phosphate transport system protein
MPKHMDRELMRLDQWIRDLASGVERSLRAAVTALRESNTSSVKTVIEGDDQIDELEVRIEDECLKIVALYQPVARDLRRIASIMKINLEMERINDLAVDIAQRVVELAEQEPMVLPHKLGQMADLAVSLVSRSVRAFIETDTREARRVCRMESDVDHYTVEVIGDLTSEMQNSAEHLEASLCYFSCTRYLQRIAAHAINIAEDVVYLVEGEVVRHRPEKLRNVVNQLPLGT